MFRDTGLKGRKIHHAYGFAGNVDDIVAELLQTILKDIGIITVGNPDFFRGKYETLTIDDARKIKEIHAKKAFSSDTPRIFLIDFYGITREAQNALLKILEEPQPGNHFFLVMPSFDILLSTLRSRLNLVTAGKSVLFEKNKDEKDTDWSDFIKKSPAERIIFVDALAAEVSDGTTAKHEVVDFLNGLESFLYGKNKNITESAGAFETIARARDYMKDRAPSVKMLLEYVALNV